MSANSTLEVPVEVLHRWRALQELRARRTAGRCECGCKKCSVRVATRCAPPSE